MQRKQPCPLLMRHSLNILWRYWVRNLVELQKNWKCCSSCQKYEVLSNSKESNLFWILIFLSFWTCKLNSIWQKKNNKNNQCENSLPSKYFICEAAWRIGLQMSYSEMKQLSSPRCYHFENYIFIPCHWDSYRIQTFSLQK